MKAIILAAGRGSRMLNRTEDRPKCLVEFHGKSLLTWQRQALNGAGINDIGLITGYRAEMLVDRSTIQFHTPRWNQTNMVRSLMFAAPWLERYPCIISYSDIIYQPLATKALMESPAAIGVLYDINWRAQWQARFENPLDDAETFRISSSGFITEIGGKAHSLDEIEGQYMGLLRTTPDGWKAISAYLSSLSDEVIDALSMTALLNQYIQKQGVVSGIPYTGYWAEVDSERDLITQQGRLPQDWYTA